MSARKLTGAEVARDLMGAARDELAYLRDGFEIEPTLAILLVGDETGSIAYRKAIRRTAASIHLEVVEIDLPENSTQNAVLAKIDAANDDARIHGVIILQPLPAHLDRIEIADRLHPLKDVDGITTFNAGRLMHGDRNVLAPSTPSGGMALLKHYNIPFEGKNAAIVGRSPVVGKPMALMLAAENATVTICHSKTVALGTITKRADILIAAAGKPGLLTGDMVKPKATVIDFGVNFQNGKMVGDVEQDSVREIAGALTPVPGGTGRVTTAILIRNTLKAARLQFQYRCIGTDV